MNKIFLGALFISVFSAPSVAKMKSYVGVNLGIGGITSTEPDFRGTTYSHESGKLAWNIHSGALFDSKTNKKLKYGAEISYSSYAKNKTVIQNLNYTYGGYNLAVMGVAKYSFNYKWSMFGKLGAAYASQKMKSNIFEFNQNESKMAPKMALGTSYNINEYFSVNASIDHVFGSDIAHLSDQKTTYQLSDFTNVGSVSALYFGVTYSF